MKPEQIARDITKENEEYLYGDRCRNCNELIFIAIKKGHSVKEAKESMKDFKCHSCGLNPFYPIDSRSQVR